MSCPWYTFKHFQLCAIHILEFILFSLLELSGSNLQVSIQDKVIYFEKGVKESCFATLHIYTGKLYKVSLVKAIYRHGNTCLTFYFDIISNCKNKKTLIYLLLRFTNCYHFAPLLYHSFFLSSYILFFPESFVGKLRHALLFLSTLMSIS